ncbi:unnamed protein product, partial [Mesorhabditis belari]|uniref:Uncharacterized protein n=1 Tax=Mesorhabditis belari TaxID=2138241 RepID=A0AAF3EGU1_9BILA
MPQSLPNTVLISREAIGDALPYFHQKSECLYLQRQHARIGVPDLQAADAAVPLPAIRSTNHQTRLQKRPVPLWHWPTHLLVPGSTAAAPANSIFGLTFYVGYA